MCRVGGGDEPAAEPIIICSRFIDDAHEIVERNYLIPGCRSVAGRACAVCRQWLQLPTGCVCECVFAWWIWCSITSHQHITRHKLVSTHLSSATVYVHVFHVAILDKNSCRLGIYATWANDCAHTSIGKGEPNHRRTQSMNGPGPATGGKNGYLRALHWIKYDNCLLFWTLIRVVWCVARAFSSRMNGNTVGCLLLSFGHGFVALVLLNVSLKFNEISRNPPYHPQWAVA